MNKLTKILILKVIAFVFIFTIGTITIQEATYPEPSMVPDIQLNTMEDSVTYEINKLNFKYPHIVLAQAKLESGNFTSNLFQQNNNMFGMKMPSRRPTTAVGKKSSYAYYNTWICSIEDQRIYYTQYLDHRTEEEVYTYLSRYYAQDKKYVQKLRAIIEKENLREKFYNDNIV
jgi:flagellum-specific peptidoglycan hydrolase FlgJ